MLPLLLFAVAAATASPRPEPCGFVEFTNISDARYNRDGSVEQHIRLTLHYADGHVEHVKLDYPFVYPNAAAFPWSRQNIGNQNFGVAFQFPPPDKVLYEPASVKFVMAHSTPDGVSTQLPDCAPKQ